MSGQTGKLVAGGFFAICQIHAAAVMAADCQNIHGTLKSSLSWKTVAPGLDYGQAAIQSNDLRDLTFIRYSNRLYRTKLFDLRDIVAANHVKGMYAPPMYSISELRRNLSQAALIASAGFTKSFSEPVPAGFLSINGSTRSAVTPKDRILDGVVCLSKDGMPSILSSRKSGSGHSPRDVGQCAAGFQAGPVLVWKPSPAFSQELRHGSWVVLATTSHDNTVIGWSQFATATSMGCVLSSAQIDAVSAIRLQSSSLGGIALGPVFQDKVPGAAVGNVDATISSALIVEAREPDNRQAPGNQR